jgi:hypothetical protein
MGYKTQLYPFLFNLQQGLSKVNGNADQVKQGSLKGVRQ